MEADALWGMRASDSAELRGHIKYLSQQESRTAILNREAYGLLIAGLSKREGVRFGAAGMDYLDSESISEEEFNARYASAGRPCMVNALYRWRRWLTSWHVMVFLPPKARFAL